MAITPREFIESLVQGLPDEPVDGSTLERVLRNMETWKNQDAAVSWVIMPDSLTPRRQLRRILISMANYRSSYWDGPQALVDAMHLKGHAPKDFSPELTPERLFSASAFFVAAIAHAQLLPVQIGLTQPIDFPTPSIDGSSTPAATAFHFRAFPVAPFGESQDGETEKAFQLRLRSSRLPVEKMTVQALVSNTAEVREYLKDDFNSEMVYALAREIALETNLKTLKLLWESVALVPAAEGQDILDILKAGDHAVFRNAMANPTHVIMGNQFFSRLASHSGVRPQNAPPTVETVAGLTRCFLAGPWPSTLRFYRSVLPQVESDEALILCARPSDLQAPIAYLPYVWTVGTLREKAEAEGLVTEEDEDAADMDRINLSHLSALQVVDSSLAVRVKLVA